MALAAYTMAILVIRLSAPMWLAAAAGLLASVIFSVLLCALPWVVEIDLDPIVVSPIAAVVARARVNIEPSRIRLAAGYRHMAIHPYPVELETSLSLRSGEVLKLRPIRPEDADLERAFVAGMSELSRYRRFMQHLPALTPQMLARFTQVDYDRELALIALAVDATGEAIVGVVRYVANPDQESAEYAIAVADSWHGRGLGRALMEALIGCARTRGFRRLMGVVLGSNAPMLALCRKLGFVAQHDPDDPDQDGRYEGAERRKEPQSEVIPRHREQSRDLGRDRAHRL